MNNNKQITGKTIVIVGASSGFGRGAALELGRLGANVVIAARRTKLLDNLATEIINGGGMALAVTTDVTKPDDIIKLKDTAIGAFNSVDIWINNVGVGALGFFWDIPFKEQAKLIDVNLKGLICGAYAAIDLFRTQGFGTLINVGSVDSEVPMALMASYAASKAAVLSFSRALKEELRLANLDKINVATIMPWAVDTPWWIHAVNYTGHEPRMSGMDDPQVVVDTIVHACVNPAEECTAGSKAHHAYIFHQIFPDLTERLSANTIDREVKKAWRAENTSGAIFEPMSEGTGIGGGIRDRMKLEDAARKSS